MNRSELLDKEYERRDQRLQNAVPMRLRKTNKQPKHLHIVYVMTWTALCGGIKIILEHCNRLTERGHKVTIVSHYPKPDWFPLDERIAFIQPGFNEVLCESIPPCDIIIAIYWTEIYECIEQGIAPVVYFEQGADHLFHPDQFKADKIAHARKQIRLAPYVYTVSNYAAQTLSEVYDVQAPVIPNAVDKTVFYPDLEMKRKNKKIVLSTIGSDYAEDKRIRHIMDCINRLRDKGYDFEFIWITPGPHDWSITEPAHTNPPQRFIGDTLRRTDIYTCASRYELSAGTGSHDIWSGGFDNRLRRHP